MGVVVLGHYPEYIELAEQLRGSCFNVPAEVWSKMSHEERWEANRKFLDEAISRGDEILLATPLARLHIGSWYERELRYLARRGFRPDASGRRLVLVSRQEKGAS